MYLPLPRQTYTDMYRMKGTKCSLFKQMQLALKSKTYFTFSIFFSV